MWFSTLSKILENWYHKWISNRGRWFGYHVRDVVYHCLLVKTKFIFLKKYINIVKVLESTIKRKIGSNYFELECIPSSVFRGQVLSPFLFFMNELCIGFNSEMERFINVKLLFRSVFLNLWPVAPCTLKERFFFKAYFVICCLFHYSKIINQSENSV